MCQKKCKKLLSSKKIYVINLIGNFSTKFIWNLGGIPMSIRKSKDELELMSNKDIAVLILEDSKN